MQDSQWKQQHTCPNCEARVETTQDYVGMISVMMPRESWVAKWNDVRNVIPGCYAISINMIDDDEADAQSMAFKKGASGQQQDQDDLNDFIANDDEEY